MRIAIVGATGKIGGHTAAALTRAGHEVVAISRAMGTDAYTGAGLDQALSAAPVDAVVDASNTSSLAEAEVVDFFGTITRNLLAAEARAGIRHHVLLSIVGLEHDRHVAHYEGKKEQERLVQAGSTPYSIVRATQFHDFAAMIAERATRDGVSYLAPLLVQPIAPSEVGSMLAEVATGEPLDATIDIAGPRTEDLVDMARRTFAARGQRVTLVPTWRGTFDTSMAGEVLLPGPDARLGTVSFDEWVAAGAIS
jgi:uncharacterized protein YbjT (DUF2867 family)